MFREHPADRNQNAKRSEQQEIDVIVAALAIWHEHVDEMFGAGSHHRIDERLVRATRPIQRHSQDSAQPTTTAAATSPQVVGGSSSSSSTVLPFF
ncbi:MAG: hypothetical protein WDO56_03675 [Gammaproteobacteria bacterium]